MCIGVSWCERDAPKFKNGNSKKYCEVCIQYRVYAKNAYIRPWLFYKVHKIVLGGDISCECCGYDPKDYYPTRPLRQQGGLMDVDHINPATKGTPEGEHPDNYQLVCKQCHVLKSYDEGDYIDKRWK